MKDSAFTVICNIIVEEYGIEWARITPELKFKEDLDADSLAVVELVMLLENHFGVMLPDDRVVSIQTVGDLIDVTEQAIKEKNSQKEGGK